MQRGPTVYIAPSTVGTKYGIRTEPHIYQTRQDSFNEMLRGQMDSEEHDRLNSQLMFLGIEDTLSASRMAAIFQATGAQFTPMRSDKLQSKSIAPIYFLPELVAQEIDKAARPVPIAGEISEPLSFRSMFATGVTMTEHPSISEIIQIGQRVKDCLSDAFQSFIIASIISAGRSRSKHALDKKRLGNTPMGKEDVALWQNLTKLVGSANVDPTPLYRTMEKLGRRLGMNRANLFLTAPVPNNPITLTQMNDFSDVLDISRQQKGLTTQIPYDAILVFSDLTRIAQTYVLDAGENMAQFDVLDVIAYLKKNAKDEDGNPLDAKALKKFLINPDDGAKITDVNDFWNFVMEKANTSDPLPVHVCVGIRRVFEGMPALCVFPQMNAVTVSFGVGTPIVDRRGMYADLSHYGDTHVEVIPEGLWTVDGVTIVNELGQNDSGENLKWENFMFGMVSRAALSMVDGQQLDDGDIHWTNQIFKDFGKTPLGINRATHTAVNFGLPANYENKSTAKGGAGPLARCNQSYADMYWPELKDQDLRTRHGIPIKP